MSRKEIGERLTSERKRLGFDSAKDFSESIAVARATYLRYESGEGSPKADDLVTMVAAGVDVHYSDRIALCAGQRTGWGGADPGDGGRAVSRAWGSG